MKTLHDLGPSPEHAKYEVLLPEFWRKVKLQETDAITLGLPAAGMYDFGRAWFGAWAHQSVDQLRECMTEDCGFIDSSTFQAKRVGREETLANCAACFETFPDMVFYPQDGTNRSLPYADYFEGQWRMVIPWRGIARWTGPLRVPGTEIVFPPSGRCLNFIGVDRYTLTDDFKITHIDTDWDQLFGLLQLMPVGLPTPSLGGMKGIALATRMLMPAMRFLGRGGSREGHREFASPFPSISSAEQWTKGDEAARASVQRINASV